MIMNTMMAVKLHKTINSMHVPRVRKNVDSPSTLIWLRDNLKLKNKSHPKLNEALNIVKLLLSA
jgi:hypothetical protein